MCEERLEVGGWDGMLMVSMVEIMGMNFGSGASRWNGLCRGRVLRFQGHMEGG